jgi:hypothetical protein
LSLLVTNEDPPNAHQAQHKEEEVVVVFNHRGGSALRASGATPTRITGLIREDAAFTRARVFVVLSF